MIAFTLHGQMPSGKNQIQQLWRNGQLKKVPNQRFCLWRDIAGMQLIQQRAVPLKPLTKPVALYCAYVPGDRITRDLPGLQDALWFLLAWVHILKDDGLIWDCQWKRLALDTKAPKLYVEIHEWVQP